MVNREKSAVFDASSYSCGDIFDIKCIQQLHEHWKFLHIYISKLRVIKIYIARALACNNQIKKVLLSE